MKAMSDLIHVDNEGAAMKAAIFHGPGDLRLEEVPEQQPAPERSPSRSEPRPPAAPT